MSDAAAIKFPTRQLEMFALRSFDFADRVEAGEIKFLDAIDVLYDSSVASGLVEEVGADQVQRIIADAFEPYRHRESEREA